MSEPLRHRLRDNSVVKGTAAGAGKGTFSDSETLHKVTCPANKRLLIHPGCVNRDVNTTLVIGIYNSDDELIGWYQSLGAASGITQFPYNSTSGPIAPPPFPLKNGDYISFTFGANMNALASIGFQIEEYDL